MVLKIVIATLIVTAVVVLLLVNINLGGKKVEKPIPSLYTVDSPQFTRTVGVMLGPALVPGNRAETLVNGDQIFPAMLKAIRGAEKTINFETYIYWSGTIGKEFADALSEHARAGVAVHVLLDAIGSSKIDQAYLQQMESAGIEVQRYNPVRWYTLARLNNGNYILDSLKLLAHNLGY